MKFFLKNFLLVLAVCFLSFVDSVNAVTNPYGKYQDLYGVKTVRCTWYAWQQAYDNTGVALPGWGNAQEWYNSAAMAGYSVGKEAKANSIAVWSSSDSYGHVAYVVSVDSNGEYMTVNEGGIPIEENEGIINGSKLSTNATNLIGFIYLDKVPQRYSNTDLDTDTKSNDSSEIKSSNNNLINLDINIKDFVFDPQIMDYTFEVSYETQIISIKATAEDDCAIVTGTGDKALKVGNNNYSIVITAEDGSTKEYKINIIRKENVVDEEKEITEEVVSNKKSKKTVFIIGIISVIILTLGITCLIKLKQK